MPKPPSQIIENAGGIESIAKELGLKYKHIANREQQQAQNKVYREDTVYVFDFGGHTQHGTPYDAVIYWNDASAPIRYRHFVESHGCWDGGTKAMVHGLLSSRKGEARCTVCFEDCDPLHIARCTCCCCGVCAMCIVKLCLIEMEFDEILDNNFMAQYQCPKCRGPIAMNFFHLYAKVQDRVEEFDEEQQKALLFTGLFTG